MKMVSRSHAQNLSDLAVSLDSLADYLDAVLGSGNVAEKGEDSRTSLFLPQQHSGPWNVEEELIQSTEHILPSKSDYLTYTELSDLCRSLLVSNIHRMRRLHEALRSDAFLSLHKSHDELEVDKTDCFSPPHHTLQTLDGDELNMTSQQRVLPVRKSFRIDESDHGKYDPSPSINSMFSSHRNTSSAAELSGMKFAASASEILPPYRAVAAANRSKLDWAPPDVPSDYSAAKSPDLVERWRSQRRSRNTISTSAEQVGEDVGSPAFCDVEGDGLEMGNETFDFSVLTSQTVIAHDRPFVKRWTHLDNDGARKPLDQTDGSDPDDKFQTRHGASHPIVGPGRSALRTMVDPGVSPTSNQNERDKTANMGKIREVKFSDQRSPNRNTNRKLDCNASSRLHPSEILSEVLVDNSSPISGTATELTMDDAIQNNSLLSPFWERDPNNTDDSVYAGSSASETPILDRYRLEPDDNSLGVKVVPNERGRRKGLMNLRLPEPSSRHRLIETKENQHVFQQSRKAFQTTPHPKGKRGMLLEQVEEEDEDTFAPSEVAMNSHEERIPLRDVEPSQLRTPAVKSKASHTSNEYLASHTRTPLTSAWIAKHLSPSEISQLMNSMEPY